MGKKKQQKTSCTSVQNLKEEKVKKTYSLSSSDKLCEDSEEVPRVFIEPDVERSILSLIQAEFRKNRLNKELSKRLTSKKLTDVYSGLSQAGFLHGQIEGAMTATLAHGGDLLDALDWLCLNIPNDQLPEGFSETLHREEVKSKPKFDTTMQTIKTKGDVSDTDPKHKQKTETGAQGGDMKDWILQYSQQESEDSEEDDNDEKKTDDPTDRYFELTSLLMDYKQSAIIAKRDNNKTQQKELSKKIRETTLEMKALETYPSFNPSLKFDAREKQLSTLSDSDSVNTRTDHLQLEQEPSASEAGKQEVEEEMECSDLSIFDENASADVPPEKPKICPMDEVRKFEYTKQQWTGKSPKQFLIDWCRKHLQRSNPPSFQKVNVRGRHFKSRVKIDRKKDGKLDVCPEILCENIKESEHLAATLALYHLCKGQSVYQLLPPPYRDVWLEWRDTETSSKQEAELAENKPRDQFIAKLLKKIQVLDSKQNEVQERDDSDAAESWEDLDMADDMSIAQKLKKVHPKDRQNREQLDSGALRTLLYECQTTDQYKSLLQTRSQLPVYQHKDSILKVLCKENIVLIAGETGSGKSTQIPQFILEDLILSGHGIRSKVICTQPRRISAISLANRVSEELGEKSGLRDPLCGYQIRFESKRGPNTRLLYCTTGVVLRQLQLDPCLKDVSHIIVDEVHERSSQSDFLLIVLKQLIKVRTDLKIILMSATLDSDKFSSYLYHCKVINIPGRTFPVQVYHMEDIVERMKYVIEEDSSYAIRADQLVEEEQATVSITGKGGSETQMEVFWTKDNITTVDGSGLQAEKYSLKTRNTVTRLNPNYINMDLILELLSFLDRDEEFKTIEGAILIFLPGLANIQELYDLISSDRRFSNKKKYQVLALHSILSSADQNLAFNTAPVGVRKVVLATNIAETGITIPDVVFVVDSGKVKESRYIESSQMSTLEEVFVSCASAKQRKGRAGRVQEGYCFRMYTKQMYDSFKPYTVPELLRVPLEELCLQIMKCGYGDPTKFLSQALDPPQPQAVIRAMKLLLEVGACIDGSSLTSLGHHLSALPVHVRIGKMLLYASIFGCLEPVAVIAAAMTEKSPFVFPLGKQGLVDSVKQALAIGYSDQLTLYKVYLGWKSARSKGRGAEMSYCQKNYLRFNTLREIENVKTDLMKLVQSIGFVDTDQPQNHRSHNIHDSGGVLSISKCTAVTSDIDQQTVAMVKAVLTAGLYPCVAKVANMSPTNSQEKVPCTVDTDQGPARVHPSSVNSCLQASGWMIYHQKVKSSRVYLRDCSMVTAYPLLLFGGDILVQHTQQQVTIDDRIKFKAYAKTGVIFNELRKLLEKFLEKKLENPSLSVHCEKLVSTIKDLIQSEKAS